MSDVVTDLSGYHKVEISEKFNDSTLNSCVQDCVRKTEIFLKVPDETRENIQLDLPNMQKKREKLLRELEKLKQRISGNNYRVKVSALSQDIHAKKVIGILFTVTRSNYRTITEIFRNFFGVKCLKIFRIIKNVYFTWTVYGSLPGILQNL